MSTRQTLLADIEARRRAQATADQNASPDAELDIAPEDNSYNPYDHPGPAKPLDVDSAITIRRKALRKLKRRRR